MIDDYHVHLEENLADCSWGNFKFALDHANPDIREAAEIASRYRHEPEIYDHVIRLFNRGDLAGVSRAYDMIESKENAQSYELVLRGLNSPDPAVVKETKAFLGSFPVESRFRHLLASFQDCDAALTGPRKKPN
jgi:hypothetical protein